MDFFNKKKIQNLEAQIKTLQETNCMMKASNDVSFTAYRALQQENETLKQFNDYFPKYCEEVNKIINEKINTMVATACISTFHDTKKKVDYAEQIIQTLQKELQETQNEVQQIKDDIITKETVKSLINKMNELLVKLNIK